MFFLINGYVDGGKETPPKSEGKEFFDDIILGGQA